MGLDFRKSFRLRIFGPNYHEICELVTRSDGACSGDLLACAAS
ncbi:hypothetical protein KOR42_52720 [Thalassoglobus neptunius]|uniref:Uncharacterized protein n=1 Tax=Thalassoglobus neptunius TaxID=1938619 RepID=A0A5C5V8Y7_9PLAN|nr:hypothetical protein KOR42_52720 [Thalassoglobus neptunius]